MPYLEGIIGKRVVMEQLSHYVIPRYLKLFVTLNYQLKNYLESLPAPTYFVQFFYFKGH